MRLFAWNVNHRTFKKKIPTSMPAGIISLEPDVIVLTEYVAANDHRFLCDSLSAGGFRHIHITDKVKGQNQVLVATKNHSEPGEELNPDPLPPAKPNFMHIRLPSLEMEVIGLRVPMYKRNVEKRLYWEWFEEMVKSLNHRNFVILGDINANKEDPRSVGGACLLRIEEYGWKIPVPTGEWSYQSNLEKTSCIDHVLVSADIKVEEARYVVQYDNHLFAGIKNGGMSDHAALVVDIDLKYFQ